MREARERGTTLPEVLVAMLVFSVVAALSVQATLILARGVSTTAATADSGFQVRAALATMERQVRSGNILFSPADEAATTPGCQAYGTSAGSCMRVYTRSDGDGVCVQWQVVPDPAASGLAVLRTRSYAPTWQTTGTVDAWHVAARGLQLPSATAAPFTLEGATSPFDARLLDVAFTSPDRGRNGQTITLTSSLAGRNTTYGYDTSLCFPAPA